MLQIVRLVIGGFWYFSVVFLIGLACWALAGLAGVRLEGTVNMEVPLAVTLAEPTPDGTPAPASARLLGHDGCRVEFRISDVSFPQRLLLVITTACSMVVTFQLRALLREIAQGRPFAAAGPIRLRVMGAMIIVATLLQASSLYSLARSAGEQLRAAGLEGSPRFVVSPEPVLLGLLVLLLAELFRLSAAMQKELELTV